MRYEKPLTLFQVKTRLKNFKEEAIEVEKKIKLNEDRLVKRISEIPKKYPKPNIDFNKIPLKEDELYPFRRKIYDYMDEIDALGGSDSLRGKLWGLSTYSDNISEFRRRLIRLKTEIIPTYEDLLSKFGDSYIQEKELERKEKENKRNEEKRLHEKYSGWKCQSLDKWLLWYREALLKEANDPKTPSYKKYDILRNIDSIVLEQKMNIIVRCYNAVGEIKTVTFTRMGNDGTFNGIVTGEKGSAVVNTIIAGGMVQRLHYRVLVK